MAALIYPDTILNYLDHIDPAIYKTRIWSDQAIGKYQLLLDPLNIAQSPIDALV